MNELKAADNRQKADTIVGSVISTWRHGAIPDAALILHQHPELLERESAVLNLATEEFTLRRMAGESLSASTFCEKFPTFRSSLMRLLLTDSTMMAGSESVRVHEFDWPSEGEEFLGFKIVQLLGSGAVARVYLAKETQLGERLVVIKVAEFAGREAEMLGKLSHPNIVRVHSIQSDPTRCLTAVCMPYFGEATLGNLLVQRYGRGKLVDHRQFILKTARKCSGCPEKSSQAASVLRYGSYVDGVVYIGQRIAEALAHAHSRHIFHRDLKPANILLAQNGEPVLLDFNLSAEASMDLPCVGGTVPFMAPERLRDVFQSDWRTNHACDPRADVYSLGIVLYQLLSGRLPFGVPDSELPHDEAAGQMLEFQETPPQRLHTLNPQIGRKLSDFVHRCIATDVNRRPQTATVVAEFLAAYLRGPRSFRRSLRQHRRILTAVTAIGLAAAVGIFSYFASRPSAGQREFALGVAALSQGDSLAAITCFSQALKLNPDSGQLWSALAKANFQAGNWSEATKCFIRSGEISRDPGTFALAGYCASRKGAHPTAIHCYDKAMTGGYREPWVCNNGAHSYMTSNSLLAGKAYKLLSFAMERDPAIRQLLSQRMLASLALANTKTSPSIDECVKDARQALALAPEDAVTNFLAAQIFAWKASMVTEDVAGLMERARVHLAKAATGGVGKPVILAARFVPEKMKSEAADLSGSLDEHLGTNDSMLMAPSHKLFSVAILGRPNR